MSYKVTSRSQYVHNVLFDNDRMSPKSFMIMSDLSTAEYICNVLNSTVCTVCKHLNERPYDTGINPTIPPPVLNLDGCVASPNLAAILDTHIAAAIQKQPIKPIQLLNCYVSEKNSNMDKNTYSINVCEARVR